MKSIYDEKIQVETCNIVLHSMLMLTFDVDTHTLLIFYKYLSFHILITFLPRAEFFFFYNFLNHIVIVVIRIIYSHVTFQIDSACVCACCGYSLRPISGGGVDSKTCAIKV